MRRVDEVKMAQALEWRALPDKKRKPATVSEFAKSIGVTKATVYTWFRKADETCTSDKWEWVLERAYQDAVKRGSSSRDKEIYARLIGKFVEKREDSVKFELTANDYINIGKRVITKLREDYKQFSGNCPICGRHQELRLRPGVDTEPELTESREMEAVALPSGLN